MVKKFNEMLEKDVYNSIISEADITRASLPENLTLIHANNKNGPKNVQGKVINVQGRVEFVQGRVEMFKVELKMFLNNFNPNLSRFKVES